MGELNRFDPYIKRFTQWIIRWRWVVVALSIVITFMAASGGRFLTFATNYRIFFSKDNPQLNAFEELQNVYTKNDNVLFVVEPKKKDAFHPDVLTLVEELVQEGWQVPYSIRVDAVTNFQHTVANGDDIIVADLIEDAPSKSNVELLDAKKVALAEPQLVNVVLSPNSNVTGVNVTVQLPEKSIAEVPEVVSHVRKVVKDYEKKYPEFNFYLTGMVMLNNAFSEASQNDIKSIVPLMYGGMILLMFFLLRSISGTFTTILIIGFSSITAVGLAGWFGVKLTPPSAQAPTMIMTLAVADSIHILVTMLHEMRLGRSKNEAIIESMRVNFSPVFMTSLTTVIGFLSMNFSDAPPFRHLGNIAAVGMTAAFIYSIFLLPALMSIFPLKVKEIHQEKSYQCVGLANFVINNRRSILWTSSFIVLLLAYFITKNVFNDQFISYFDKKIEFRTDSDFAMENLTGIYQVEHSIGSGESSGISNPAYLAKLEEFEQWYRKQPGVIQVNSFSHVMKRLNKSMHGDNPSYFKIPGSQELAAQYLLLYEFSLPYGLDLNNQINVDKSATRFTVTLGNITTNEIRDIANRAEQWLKENAPEKMFAYGVGPAVMFSHITERNTKGMIKGTTLALFIISFCLIFTFRSFKFGFLSLVPNLVPAIMAFGLWGYFIGEVGLALSVVTGMTLGIVVDDTVHFINKYLRARREQDKSPEESVQYAFRSVGVALMATSLILVGGFLILSLSTFKLNSGMGQLTALVIALALLADFTLLPALLMTVDRGSEAVEEPITKKGESHEEVLPTAG